MTHAASPRHFSHSNTPTLVPITRPALPCPALPCPALPSHEHMSEIRTPTYNSRHDHPHQRTQAHTFAIARLRRASAVTLRAHGPVTATRSVAVTGCDSSPV
ncbi:hypothetical protein GCM10011578_096550 [Streptomyces fuscichromogenes]|uniref:Uncharacterized protein n=1 Tax=Streptomyces fuscichromogenes TaxID=1324013 RepID=A0A917XQ60_9ACTN|nr:hypothetical protein GCM10011578_096550 [Streptomyces fuscichromogenes]